jgi:two-component system chemotaxis sensor kinase CheA
MSGPEDLEKRAIAAEKTVDVLKKRVFDLYNGGESALARQLEKSRRREEDNRRRRELFELRAAELKRYSETLEVEVARRTEAIKTILDNVTFGFLVVGRDLIVRPESTRSCLRLFDAAKVEGEHLATLLQLSERSRLAFDLGCDQVFEDVLPEEASLAQMQRKFPMKDGRVLEVEASVLRGKAGEVTALLLTISDITALEAARRESHTNRTLVHILKQRDSFRTFLADARAQLEAARHALADNDQSAARHALHTIKGNSASYGLEEVVDLVHAIEEEATLRAEDVDCVASALRQFLETNERVLELKLDAVGDEGFAVTREQMMSLQSLVAGMHGAEASELRRWTARVLRRPAGLVLGPVEDFAQKLANRLGKVISFRLEGGDVNVDVETVRPVFQVVAHLLRNAVDHGIEPPMDRRGKRLAGEVVLEVVDEPEAYVVRCTDDGRGIDTEALGDRAVKLGFVQPEALAAMNARSKLDLVFVDGVSSAVVTTSISGRGVGMSAVRGAVQRAGGHIAIDSERGERTTFTLTIPKGREEATS